MRRLSALAMALVLACVSSASATPITLFNTGVTAANNPDGTNGNIQGTGGAPDPNYNLVSIPVTGPISPTPALVVTDQGAYFRPGNSQYVNDIGSANASSAVGNYDFQTHFDLTGLIPSTATITGSIYVDNSIVDVLVNGTSTGINGGSFGQNTELDFTIPVGFAGFGAGVNTLDFVVNNAGGDPNPMALDVTLLQGTATPTPEPASWLLIGLGSCGLWMAARRRKSLQ